MSLGGVVTTFGFCVAKDEPRLFFTPDQIMKRRRQWGAEALGTRLSEAWRAFLDYVKPWLSIEYKTGPAGMERVYR